MAVPEPSNQGTITEDALSTEATAAVTPEELSATVAAVASHVETFQKLRKMNMFSLFSIIQGLEHSPSKAPISNLDYIPFVTILIVTDLLLVIKIFPVLTSMTPQMTNQAD